MLARTIEAITPDAIHIATEGPIGVMTRAYCLKHGLSFTTSYTTQFPEYISARWAVPEAWTYAALRRFHAAAAVTMVSTTSLAAMLAARGFRNLGRWTRGVDTELFTPTRAVGLDLPRPIFLTAGRVAIEKNLAAFLSLDLPGSKVVVGEGPQEAELRRAFPAAHFVGVRHGTELAALIAAADVFVFPSRTDTFGVAQLEALACGVPVAAFPVMGPKRRHRRPSRGRPERRSARGVPAGTVVVARGVPRLRPDLLVGEQRAPIHRPSAAAGGRQIRPTGRWRRRCGGREQLDDRSLGST